MANDSYEITVKGAGGAGQTTQLNTSGIQRAIDQVANDLKKLDTSNFQKGLRDLTQGIQKSAIAATQFVSNMQKIEAQLSSAIKTGLSPGMGKATASAQAVISNATSKKSDGVLDSKTSEKFTKSIGTLSDAIDKLTSGIKENFKPKEKSPEEPEKKANIVNDVKKLLAAVGIGSLVKQVAENEFVNPARNAGMLISSNVVSNPGQLGSQLLSSYGDRVASNTGNILGLAGAATAFIPGIGLPLAGLLSLGGKAAGDIIGQTQTAPETAIKQRAIGLDYYSNLAGQLPGYGQFAQSQYGNSGLMSQNAVGDPYFESRAVLGRGYSRFAGGSLSGDTTSGILKSLTAQGASSPQELNLTGNLLGQIARFTGKTSIDIEKVYKSVEKSGMGPNEGLQRALSLLQSGLSVKETTDLIRGSSQRTEAYGAGQLSYLSSTPFQQISAQLAGNISGIDTEKFYHGTSAERARENAKAHRIFQESNKALRAKDYNNFAIIRAQVAETMQHIFPSETDNGLQVSKATGNKFITPGKIQAGVVQDAQDATNAAAKNRTASQLVDDTLVSIGKSIKEMGGLGDAAHTLATAFQEAATAIFGSSILAMPTVVRAPLAYPSLPQARKN